MERDRGDAAGAGARAETPGAAWIAAGGGVLLVAAGIALWASEGGRVFAENAFAAFVACF